MRLAALLAEMEPQALHHLRAELLGPDENVAPAAVCATLEGVIRSYSLVRGIVVDRLPPTFAILSALIESDGFSVPGERLPEIVEQSTRRLIDRVRDGDLVGREDGLRLYRRVLVEARRNDVAFDASETALLGVLRRELGIRPVEHFLLEHHQDFDEFVPAGDRFALALAALCTKGIVFRHGAAFIVPEEIVPLVRQTLGYEMSSASRRRMFDRLSSQDIADVLAQCALRTSGSRDERLDRLLDAYIQPSEVLRTLALQTLREWCRELGLTLSGSKEQIVDNLVEFFLHDQDLRKPEDAPSPPPIPPQPRALDDMRFRALFGSLKGDDLSDILSGIESSRVTGAKEVKIALLVGSPFSEATLLDGLTNRVLEDSLARLRLRTSGSKQDRIQRVVDYFRTAPEFLLRPPSTPTEEPAVSAAPTSPSTTTSASTTTAAPAPPNAGTTPRSESGQ